MVIKMAREHIKNYFEAHGLDIGDTLTCEVCSKPAVDIHHIQPKGMGGSKRLDGEENLIVLCRDCHNQAHESKLSKDYLRRCKR